MDGKLNQYLDRVCVEIIDASSHQGIRDELADHFYCLVDTYMDMDHSEEYAVDRALADLGNAHVIGKSLNNIHTPSVKWIVAWASMWLVSTIGIIISLVIYKDITSIIMLFSVIIDFILLKSYIQFLHKVVIKKESLPFVRFSKPINKVKAAPSYVERLTNRVFAIIGIIFALLLISSSIGMAFEGGFQDMEEIVSSITFIAFIIKGTIQVYGTIKHPILIAFNDGILMGGMTKVLKWENIENYYFKTDYKGITMLVVKPKKGYTLKIPCLPIDRDKISHLLRVNKVLKKA